MSSEITDETPMAFGKHEGVALGEVPASYLLWLYDNGRAGRYTDYIEQNMKHLQREDRDSGE